LARLLNTPGTKAPAELIPTRWHGPRPDIAADGWRRAWLRPRLGPTRRWALLLVAGWLCQAGLRAWFSRGQIVPLANPDESAYLIAARVLAGGPTTDFSYSTLYQGGYPLLITPVFWFTSNALTVYRAVLLINAAVSATIMPLGYVTVRRLGLNRPAAYTVAMVAALVPAGFFYAEYAMTDAIYPALVLAWLVTTHSWLTARTPRVQYAAAAGSALLAGYAYAVHTRGTVIVLAYLALGVLVAWRRLAPRRTIPVAAVGLAASVGGGWLLDRYLSSVMYPEGTRDLSSEMATRLHSVHGAINVFEMASGQLWRLVLDGWGLAGIGLFAAAAVLARRRFRRDLRIMAALALAVTLVTAATAPAALPPDQSQTWASGRYLDSFIVLFFLVGAVVLLRVRPWRVLAFAAGTAVLAAITAAIVDAYAGSSLPTAGFTTGFNFGEPAVLTQNWTQASVWLATAVALGLLAVWVAVALAARRWNGVVLSIFGKVSLARVLRGVLMAGLAAVSLVALTQMTNHISRASTPAQEASTSGFVAAAGLKPGDQIAVAYTIGSNASGTQVGYWLWAPQAFEVSWTELQFFNPAQSPPAGVNVVETGWPTGQPASASWPHHPSGWRIVASNQAGGWVVWRKSLCPALLAALSWRRCGAATVCHIFVGSVTR